MLNAVILLNLPFMMKFVIMQAVIHRTSFLITLKHIHVYSPPSSVLQAACNLNGIVRSTGNCKIMLGQEDPTAISSHDASSVMLGISFVITHVRCHASLLF